MPKKMRHTIDATSVATLPSIFNQNRILH